MPDKGRLTEDIVAHVGPVVSPLYPPPPWKISGARILKVIFETDKEPVLDWLPPKLTRSSPPYGMIAVEHYPDTPVGPFTVAHQFIGCRAGFFVRAFALQSVVDCPVALAALREVWGFPCRLGSVSLEERSGILTATIGTEGTTLCEVRMTDTESIEPDLVRFDPVLTLRLVPSLQENVRHDLIQLVQIDPDIEVRDAQRGKGVIEYPGQSEGQGWSVLPCRNVISVTCCTVDSELPLARFVMPY